MSWGNLVIIAKLEEALKSCTRVLWTLPDGVESRRAHTGRGVGVGIKSIRGQGHHLALI